MYDADYQFIASGAKRNPLLCYTRYIIRHLIGPLLFVTLSLTGILWLAQSLRFVDLIINRGLSVGTFIYLTALLLPSLLSIVLPIALFCAVMYVYNKLLSDSELVVLESSGLSKLQLARPALIMALFMTLLGYGISLYLQPVTYRAFKDLQFFIRNNYASLLLEEGVFNSPVDGMTVYIRKRADNGALRGIMVHDNRDAKNPSTMMAEEGLLVQTSAGPRFILEEGNRQEIDQTRGQLSLLNFSRYTLDISLYTKNDGVRWREPKERFINELFFATDTDAPDRIAKLKAEGHRRLTWPLYSIALTMVGLGALLSGQFNRRGMWRRITLATLGTVIMVTGGISLTSVVTKQPMMFPLMYGVIIIGTVVGVWILRRQNRRKIPEYSPHLPPAKQAAS